MIKVIIRGHKRRDRHLVTVIRHVLPGVGHFHSPTSGRSAVLREFLLGTYVYVYEEVCVCRCMLVFSIPLLLQLLVRRQTALLVERIRVIFGQNRSVGDTSMKIVMSSVHGSLDKKTVLAT